MRYCSSDLPYPVVHALTIVGTTLAIHGLLGLVFTPEMGPVRVTPSLRIAGGVAFVAGTALVAWGLGALDDRL